VSKTQYAIAYAEFLLEVSNLPPGVGETPEQGDTVTEEDCVVFVSSTEWVDTVNPEGKIVSQEMTDGIYETYGFFDDMTSAIAFIKTLDAKEAYVEQTPAGGLVHIDNYVTK
jgi:hypothetical protein